MRIAELPRKGRRNGNRRADSPNDACAMRRGAALRSSHHTSRSSLASLFAEGR
ncbi:hypothetical protein ACSS6W_003261 [Trichoderma asperelloides]